jgi:hypothetical protein
LFVLDPPADLAELDVGEFHHMKGVRHLNGIGELLVEHR